MNAGQFIAGMGFLMLGMWAFCIGLVAVVAFVEWEWPEGAQWGYAFRWLIVCLAIIGLGLGVDYLGGLYGPR